MAERIYIGGSKKAEYGGFFVDGHAIKQRVYRDIDGKPNVLVATLGSTEAVMQQSEGREAARANLKPVNSGAVTSKDGFTPEQVHQILEGGSELPEAMQNYFKALRHRRKIQRAHSLGLTLSDPKRRS